MNPDIQNAPPPSDREGAARLPVATAIIVLASLLVPLLPGVGAALQWTRDTGDPWRWVTAHLAHFNMEHLFWSGATFALLGFLVEGRSRRALLACVALSAIAITCGLALVSPEVGTYRGLSGIDCALFVWLALALVKEQGRRSAGIIGAAALVLLSGKLAFEITTGATLFVDSTAQEFVAVPLAHVFGGIAGAIVSLLPPAVTAARTGWVRGRRSRLLAQARAEPRHQG